MGRNEGDALAGAEHDIARHHCRVPDADGNVDPYQGDVRDRGRIDSAAIDRVIGQFQDAGVVTDAAVDDHAGAGAAAGGGGEIVADEGAVVDLAEEIDHQHIVFLKLVDDPGILTAGASLGRADSLHDILHVLPLRYELRGDDPAGQGEIGLGLQPVALELEVVVRVGLFQDAPGLIVGHQLHALDDVVRHLGTAIVEPLTGPGRGPGRHAIGRFEDHPCSLCVIVDPCSMFGSVDSDRTVPLPQGDIGIGDGEASSQRPWRKRWRCGRSGASAENIRGRSSLRRSDPPASLGMAPSRAIRRYRPDSREPTGARSPSAPDWDQHAGRPQGIDAYLRL